MVSFVYFLSAQVLSKITADKTVVGSSRSTVASKRIPIDHPSTWGGGGGGAATVPVEFDECASGGGGGRAVGQTSSPGGGPSGATISPAALESLSLGAGGAPSTSGDVPGVVQAMGSVLDWVDGTLKTLAAAQWTQVGFEPAAAGDGGGGGKRRPLYSMTNPNARIDAALALYKAEVMGSLQVLVDAMQRDRAAAAGGGSGLGEEPQLGEPPLSRPALVPGGCGRSGGGGEPAYQPLPPLPLLGVRSTSDCALDALLESDEAFGASPRPGADREGATPGGRTGGNDLFFGRSASEVVSELCAEWAPGLGAQAQAASV